MRSMFTHGSRRVIIAAEVTACWRWPRRPAGRRRASATRAQSRRAARSLAIVGELVGGDRVPELQLRPAPRRRPARRRSAPAGRPPRPRCRAASSLASLAAGVVVDGRVDGVAHPQVGPAPAGQPHREREVGRPVPVRGAQPERVGAEVAGGPRPGPARARPTRRRNASAAASVCAPASSTTGARSSSTPSSAARQVGDRQAAPRRAQPDRGRAGLQVVEQRRPAAPPGRGRRAAAGRPSRSASARAAVAPRTYGAEPGVPDRRCGASSAV